MKHVPVLTYEAIEALNLSKAKIFVDATSGLGGHSQVAIDRYPNLKTVILIDKDPYAVETTKDRFRDNKNVVVFHRSYSELTDILQEKKIMHSVDAILFDLGVSSPQLDQSERGFSFQSQGPLDMRMNTNAGKTAREWLIENEEADIENVLKVYGEERFRRPIAKAIKEALSNDDLHTTTELAALISKTVPKTEWHKHPATRTFQAIRIAVNRELEELDSVLPQALSALKAGGRMSVISFHSLEDRKVKQFFRKNALGDDFPPDLPIQHSELKPNLRLVGKPVRASSTEVANNPRSRSAIMRVAEKI